MRVVFYVITQADLNNGTIVQAGRLWPRRVYAAAFPRYIRIAPLLHIFDGIPLVRMTPGMKWTHRLTSEDAKQPIALHKCKGTPMEAANL